MTTHQPLDPTFSGEADAPQADGYLTEVTGAPAFYWWQRSGAAVADLYDKATVGAGSMLFVEAGLHAVRLAPYGEHCPSCKLALWPVGWHEGPAGLACAYKCPRCGKGRWKTHALPEELAWVN